MFNKKIILILTIFIVSLFAISAVSAVDNATNDVVGMEETTDEVVSVSTEDVNDAVTTSNDDNSVSANYHDGDEVTVMEEDRLSASIGTFTDLANEIQNADNELKLTKNYSYVDGDSEFNNEIVINKTITIDGNGFTINGNEKNIVFYIKSSKIILKNINFENFKGKSLGAIFFAKGTNAEIINSTFTNNHIWQTSGTTYGGCIYASSSNLKIKNTIFIGNRANADSYAYGGCIYASSSKLEIENTSFTGNYAVSNGGCIYTTSSTLKIANSSFIENYSPGLYSYGGCIYASSSKLEIENTSFTGNYAKYGGSIYVASSSNLKIKNSIFTGNRGFKNGGSIGAGSSYLEIENTSFIKNRAYGEGGSIIVYNSKLFLKSCNFTNNKAEYLGAALYYSASMGMLENCKFKNNILSNRITSPLDKQYIQDGCLINCDFDNSDINMTIGGGLRNITQLKVTVTNNIVDITVIEPNYYDGGDYFLAIEKYPFPTSHKPLSTKDSLRLYNNHATAVIEDMDLGVNNYRVFYSNLIHEFYYYFNITITAQSSISVDPITVQRGTQTLLKIKINDCNGVYVLGGGYVELTIDNETYKSQVISGKSEITITSPKKAGTFNYNVTFNPSSKYIYGSSTNLKIVSKYGTKVTVKSVTGYQGNKVKLTATVKDDNKKYIKKGSVSFKINGNTYTAKVKDGKASITIYYPEAKVFKVDKETKNNVLTKTTYYRSVYDCEVSFKGYGEYLNSSSTFKVTSKKKSKVTREYIKPKPTNNPTDSGSGSNDIPNLIIRGQNYFRKQCVYEGKSVGLIPITYRIYTGSTYKEYYSQTNAFGYVTISHIPKGVHKIEISGKYLLSTKTILWKVTVKRV